MIRAPTRQPVAQPLLNTFAGNDRPVNPRMVMTPPPTLSSRSDGAVIVAQKTHEAVGRRWVRRAWHCVEISQAQQCLESTAVDAAVVAEDYSRTDTGAAHEITELHRAAEQR